MEKLDEIEHPKPLREFVYDTFNRFAAEHPWVGNDNIRPKSIAREMYERYQSFAEHVRDYGLQRVEGLLLRHLSQVWKVLAQTVPSDAKTEEVVEMEIYFRELIRGIDSSLVEEWERMRNPEFVAAEGAEKPDRPTTFDVTRDTAGFRRLVRAGIFAFLQDVQVRDWESAAEKSGVPAADLAATAKRLEAEFGAYFAARERFRLDPAGRSLANTHWREDRERGELAVAQMLVDASEANDWEAIFAVDLTASRAESRAVVCFATVRAVGA